ncbi:hypothetical protein FSP39_002929 [Pinctada imbricata]|uniref:MI domain-containing protein n=1 Tax=Pinctada imbricata TaxID=66713 RepID=A0AA88YH94_PINIB|nr:hypothetical protein FSP39_002929 [Pinctada imbricata]
MGRKRKKGFRKDDQDQPNLKRFRDDLLKLIESSDHSGSQSFDLNKQVPQINRKQRRKEERKLKKARRNAHSMRQKVVKNSRKASSSLGFLRRNIRTRHQQLRSAAYKAMVRPQLEYAASVWDPHTLPTLESRMETMEKKNKEQKEMERKEKMKEKKLKDKERRKQRQSEKKKMEEERRREAVREDIRREEKMLKHLEKQLHLNKRKSKNLPQSFIDDGLDYLLDVVDENKMSDLYNEGAESDLEDLKEEDEDDFSGDDDASDAQETNLVDDKSRVDKLAKKILKLSETSEKEGSKENSGNEKKKVHFEDDELDDDDLEENDSEQEPGDDDVDDLEDEDIDDLDEDEIDDCDKDDVKNDDSIDDEENENDDDIDSDGDENDDDTDSEDEEKDDDEEDNGYDDELKKEKNMELEKPVYKEDIYGRLRDEEGNIVPSPAAAGGKYVPPGKRLQLAGGDQKKKVQLERLKKQLKGLVNRASESNMQAICSQIEIVFLGNSRADVTETLSMIIIEAVVSPSLTPERLVMEMVMLLAVLHGNIGNEIGATFLEHLAHKFEELCNHGDSYGDGKEMDNVVLLISHMYNFKVIHSLLIIDVIRKFLVSFMEKDVELLLLILKNVGFSLRKDDAIALKEIIQEIQSKAVAMDTSKSVDQSRVRFMLDTLLAIKNNNMRKIPNYDPDLIEQLKKSTRNVLRGTTLGDGQLRISLDDLLHAENKGKWWVVGSAWEGRDKGVMPDVTITTTSSVIDGMSSKILQLAHKQRMNTDIRRNIFCVMMTAEDYIDAFEKLMRLGLKNQQEREIIHVIIDSCQQEKTFNPFYALLMQKFCECDRRFQMTFQFALWDKFKEMGNLTEYNRSNLAKLVTYLLSTKAQSLSIFKVVEFGTLDTAMVRFMKQVLTELLVDHPEDISHAVFIRIAPLSKLQMLQEGLKLFMQHFLLRKKSKDLPADPKLKDRVTMAIKALSAGQSKMLL